MKIEFNEVIEGKSYWAYTDEISTPVEKVIALEVFPDGIYCETDSDSDNLDEITEYYPGPNSEFVFFDTKIEAWEYLIEKLNALDEKIKRGK